MERSNEVPITSEESVSETFEECGTERGDEGICFREVILHSCDVITSKITRGPVKGPSVKVRF